MDGQIKVSNERLAIVENEIGHIKSGMEEIKSSVSEVNGALGDIRNAVVKLSAIAELDQHIKPRVEKLERKFYIWSGALATLMFALTLFKAPLLQIFS